MQNNYKVIISGKNLYEELELPAESNELKVGTFLGDDLRLLKDFFFEPIELTFIRDNGQWTVYCSENLYLSSDSSSRRIITTALKHGNLYTVKYQASGSDAIRLEFLVDFDTEKRDYERSIDITNVSEVRIGSAANCNIRLSSKYVQSDYVVIKRQNDVLLIDSVRTTYGIYINGNKAIIHDKIYEGDFLYISDFVFCYKGGRLWTEIRDDIVLSDLPFSDNIDLNDYPRFYRNARIKKTISDEKIEILDPPASPQKPRNNLFLSLLPSLGMLLTAGLMASMGGASMILFSAVTGGIAIITSVVSVIQSKNDFKKETKERVETYSKYIDNKRREITELRNAERATREAIYLSQEKERNLLSQFSSELFDRRPADSDFLQVRLGTGSITPSRHIEIKKQERLNANDELQSLPEKVSEEFAHLADAPVVCNLQTGGIIGLVGSEENRYSMMRNIIWDICIRHFCSDVQIFFIAEEQHRSNIEWLRFLPHVINRETGLRNIAFDQESRTRAFDYLFKELSERTPENKGSHIIVFFYDSCGYHSHPISKFADRIKELAVTFVFLAEQKDKIPQGCTALIAVNSESEGYLTNTENDSETTNFHYHGVSVDEAEQLVNKLAPVYAEEISLEGSLTKNISLFEMLGIFSADDLDLQQRWKTAEVYKSMAVPIGVTKAGIVSLDLHDKAHGPHGLVAGTTGSGKSEILQTYILSVASFFHPYEVAFVIIDFKGGGMVNQFKNLPHLLGAITNIDGKEINRSLKSIKAELSKRQRLFADAEVNHIDKYIQKYKSGEVSEPMPHLILIVDEFAELRAEQPDFMKELISAARIGRSLGVHLILATQKPSGQVDDQIWSNSRFKLCLKVQTQEDSNEVLKSPLAVEIKEPGRAYLQVGNNEVFELLQSAFSGAPEKIADARTKEFSIFEVSASGKKQAIYVKRQEKDKGGRTQLEAIVEYVNQYCSEHDIGRLPNICLDPLKKLLPFPANVSENRSLISIGVFDDPDNQVQEDYTIDIDNKNTIVIGSAQTGKTNLLQSLLRTIAISRSPKDAIVYILDFGSQVLKIFESLNHVGGVVCASDDEKLRNLIKLLFEEITKRKEKLAALGLSSFSAYSEAGYRDLPHIYVLIDNFTSLMESYFEDNDDLLSLLRDGLSVGISIIAANAQTSGISYRYMANFGNKIALHCNDSAEYSNLFDHAGIQPDDTPGRCIVEHEKKMLECQLFLAFDGVREIDRAKQIQLLIEEINKTYPYDSAKPIPYIPSMLPELQFLKDCPEKNLDYSLPIGLTYQGVEPYYLDLSQLGIFGLCGKENTGHRNFLRFILKHLSEKRQEHPVRVALFDDVSRKLSEFKRLPIVDKYSLSIESVGAVLAEWQGELERRHEQMLETETLSKSEPFLLMVIQNNDVARAIADDLTMMDQFNDLVNRFRSMKVSVIFSNFPNASLPYDAPEPLRMVKQEQHILFFEDLDNLKAFDVPYEEMKANKKRLIAGDAYYISDNTVTKLKIPLVEEDGSNG